MSELRVRKSLASLWQRRMGVLGGKRDPEKDSLSDQLFGMYFVYR